PRERTAQIFSGDAALTDKGLPEETLCPPAILENGLELIACEEPLFDQIAPESKFVGRATPAREVDEPLANGDGDFYLAIRDDASAGLPLELKHLQNLSE